MPRVYRSCWNLMTWVDPETIYTTKATIGFKRNPKESALATNIKCTLQSQLSLSIFHELLVEWVSNVQLWNLEDSLFYIYFQQSQVCAGFFPQSQLKRKISNSLIHMGFIGLVTLSGVRGLWRKGLERLKKCLRVTLSKNLESLACTFVTLIIFACTFVTLFLLVNSWVRLYFFCHINPFCTFVPSL